MLYMALYITMPLQFFVALLLELKRPHIPVVLIPPLSGGLIIPSLPGPLCAHFFLLLFQIPVLLPTSTVRPVRPPWPPS